MQKFLMNDGLGHSQQFLIHNTISSNETNMTDALHPENRTAIY